MKKQLQTKTILRFKSGAGKGFYHQNPAVLVLLGSAFFAAVFAGALILSDNWMLSLIAAATVTPFFVRSYKKAAKERKKKRIEKQFLEAMQLVLSAVSAGNSVEQAMVSVLENQEKGHSSSIGDIAMELDSVCRKTGMLYRFYDELMLFAVKTESENIISCVNAMSIVAVRGGDMTYVIRNALANLRVKFETDDEIMRALSLPKYNLRIITVMPFALVLLIKNMSEGYMDALYETNYGLAVSIGAMTVIAGAWLFGSKLCDVKL